jgi:hypothetical protein
MRAVAAHQDSESRVKVRSFIEKLLEQPMSLGRRKEVIASAKKFGIANAGKLEDEYFDALLNDYFMRPTANNSNINDVVRISFEHPEYLPKLRDYYLTHTITFDVEYHFLDRVKQYRLFPDYDIMAAAVEQGRKRYEYQQGLFRKCGDLSSSREQDPVRAKNGLITILQARLETDARVKFMNENGSGGCIDASRYWIHGEDKAKFRARTDLMVEVAEENKKFAPMILEILNFRFATNYTNLEDWKRWWTKPESTDANKKHVAPAPAAASKSTLPRPEEPYSMKKYHVHYDVREDGTYLELDEVVMNVETEAGIQMASHFPLGMPKMGYKIGKRDVEVLAAYTLKKSGQHIEAIGLNPQAKNFPAASDPVLMQPSAQAKMVAFQDVDVGDNLIFSFKVIQTEAPSPGNVALTQIIPNFFAHEDIVISLSAPIPYKLQIEAIGFEAPDISDIGGIRNWVWKYQNKKAKDTQTGNSAPFNPVARIHISSFKDMATEMNALMMEAPMPKNQAAGAAPAITKKPATH